MYPSAGRYQSGQLDLTVDQVASRLRGFESLPAHQLDASKTGANKVKSKGS